MCFVTTDLHFYRRNSSVFKLGYHSRHTNGECTLDPCSEQFVNLQEQPEIYDFFQILVPTLAYSGFHYYYFCLLKQKVT